MPGNDLTDLRALVPQPATTRAVARANITELLTGILDDIEPDVTSAQININSDLSFLSGGSRYAATDVSYLGLEDRSTDTTQVSSVYTRSGDLYYHDGDGNAVRITSGGAVSASAGNITGAGYGTSDVEVNWHSGTSEYRFKTGSASTDLADLVMDKARFSDGGGTDYATLGAQSSMSGVVDYSLPLAAPAGTYLMTMDVSGNMAHTTTPSVASVTASGTITAVGDMSADDYKITGTRKIIRGGSAWAPGLGGGWDIDANALSNTNTLAALCVPLDAGDRITDVQVYGQQTTAGTLTLSLHSIDDAGTVSAAVAQDSTTSTGVSLLSLTSLAESLSIGKSYVLYLTASASQARCMNTEIAYDRP